VKSVHGGVNALCAGEAMIRSQRVEILFASERSFGLSLDENILAEVRHFFFATLLVEGDEFFQRVHQGSSPTGEIGVEVGF
jgi:hypothetical protein